MDLDDTPLTHSSAPTRQAFTAEAFSQFLESGWFLSVPSRSSQQILVGWGALEAHVASPVMSVGQAALFAPDFRLKNANPWISTPHWDLMDRSLFSKFVMEHVARAKVSGKSPSGNSISGNKPGEFAAQTGSSPIELAAQTKSGDSSLIWCEPPRELFDRRFREITARFATHQLDKAVPVVFATAQSQVSQLRCLEILEHLIGLPSHLIIYGFWGKLNSYREGMIGVTPELLFSLVDGSLETAALAATRAKPPDPADNAREARALMDDPKERTEHQFVIDDISHVLEKVGEVKVGPTGILELPTLFHLKTSIRARLNRELSLDQASKLLHPTPALGFAPRTLGMSEMDHWDDGVYRWRYGAPFGVDAALSPVERLNECVVAIRNIQWRDEDIRLGSGCGVVRASVADREWQELKLKRDSVKRILGV